MLKKTQSTYSRRKVLKINFLSVFLIFAPFVICTSKGKTTYIISVAEFSHCCNFYKKYEILRFYSCIIDQKNKIYRTGSKKWEKYITKYFARKCFIYI